MADLANYGADFRHGKHIATCGKHSSWNPSARAFLSNLTNPRRDLFHRAPWQGYSGQQGVSPVPVDKQLAKLFGVKNQFFEVIEWIGLFLENLGYF